MKLFYDHTYVESAQDFETLRKAESVAVESINWFDARGRLSQLELASPRPATAAELGLVHNPSYVQDVHDGVGRAESAGFRWDPGYRAAVLASTGGAVDAALTAIADGTSGSLSSGLHHAGRDEGAGFCTFNGLALAARAVLGDMPSRCPTRPRLRVLILDLDAHCGGGTYDIIRDDPRIHQIDISTSPLDSYERDDKHRLFLVSRPEQYLQILRAELRRAIDVGFDMVLYNAGMDAHELGGGGITGLTTDLIREREAIVFSWARRNGLPIAFVLAGGYTGYRMSHLRLARLHTITVAAAAGVELPQVSYVDEEPERKRRGHARV